MWIVNTLLLMLAHRTLRDSPAVHTAWGNLIADDPIHFMFAALITTSVVRQLVKHDAAVWLVHTAALALAHGVTDMSQFRDVPALKVVARSHPVDLMLTLWFLHRAVGVAGDILHSMWAVPVYVWCAVRDYGTLKVELAYVRARVGYAKDNLKFVRHALDGRKLRTAKNAIKVAENALAV